MKIEQIYTGCIAQAAYYIESNGEAAIIDPLREVKPYLDRAAKDNAQIKYIFETHFHADFVSGHLDLAKKSGGQIVYGPTAKPQFEAIIAKDNQEFKVGAYTIKAIHTPGHTLESTCYLLIDETGKQHGIITGDTLFIGDVGRPDLAQELVGDLTQEKLASYLFDSLRNKIMPLADDLIVYPSHGAGSACGKNMSKETTDTLGNQKNTNYALRADMTREEFTRELLDGLGLPPAYFPQNVMLNIQGYESLDSIINQTYQNVEILVMDDASIDSTPEIIASYGDKIHGFRQPENKGQFGNVNDGVSFAKGKYTAIYHADDVYDSKIIEREIDFLEKQDLPQAKINQKIIFHFTARFLKMYPDLSYIFHAIFGRTQPHLQCEQWTPQRGLAFLLRY